MLKIASWNVNSLTVRLEQVLAWLDATAIDILAVQETKLTDANFPSTSFLERGYQVIFSGQKAYNGVAIISRLPLSEAIVDIPNLVDPQRRIIAATIAGVRIINLYVPNGSIIGSDKYAYKLAWLEEVTDFIRQQLAHFKYVVVLGDFNIAPEDQDVHDAAQWQDSVLVSMPERQAFAKLLTIGLHDSFRLFPQNEHSFSWWDYRANSFRRNRGLRIDHILVNTNLVSNCLSCQIDRSVRALTRPSDHAPVWLELTTE